MNSIKNGGMVVLSIPTRLKLATLGLMVSVPLISLEVAIVARAPVWNLPYRNIGYWALTFALISVPLMVWIMSGKKWALSICSALVSLWILASIWMTFHIGYPQLGFFTLLLFLFFVVLLMSLKYEMGRSFFDPGLPWYQGMPKSIPGLKCRLEKTVDLDVCRLDQDGAFLFCPNKDSKHLALLPSLLAKRRLEMIFYFRDRQVECQGAPILSLNQGTGAGIQFLGATDDLSKDIGDFVELLRGEGYV
ncbi:MAG: hypothetical protein ABIQ95_05640 [Bdellovibrionia bacterium]